MSLIIASTHGEIPDQLGGADLLELRVDGLEDAVGKIPSLLAESPVPTILTCRSVEEGGMFEGGEDERVGMYNAAVQSSQPPRYIDIEFESLARHPLLLDSFDRTNTGVILSWHNTLERPNDLFQRATEMQDVAEIDVVKMVWRARSLRDNFDAFELLKTKQQPMIAMCMGEYGLMSRVLTPKFGGFATYAAVGGHAETAPAQPTVEMLETLFHFKQINEQTKVFGVVGSDVEHSASPAFHNAAFKENNTNAVYLPFPIPEGWEQLKATVLELMHCDRLVFSGASITIPHKVAMFKLVESLKGSVDEVTQVIGAVNTIDCKGNALVASNTDVLAIESLLKGAQHVLILGAGGVARAAVMAMANQGAKVCIAARNEAQAIAITGDLPCKIAPEEMTSYDAIINCTPVGMEGGTDELGNPLLQLAPHVSLTDGCIVFETVYNPVHTPLVQLAQSVGCKTITGVEMFKLQATLQQERWN